LSFLIRPPLLSVSATSLNMWPPFLHFKGHRHFSRYSYPVSCCNATRLHGQVGTAMLSGQFCGTMTKVIHPTLRQLRVLAILCQKSAMCLTLVDRLGPRVPSRRHQPSQWAKNATSENVRLAFRPPLSCVGKWLSGWYRDLS